MRRSDPSFFRFIYKCRAHTSPKKWGITHCDHKNHNGQCLCLFGLGNRIKKELKGLKKKGGQGWINKQSWGGRIHQFLCSFTSVAHTHHQKTKICFWFPDLSEGKLTRGDGCLTFTETSIPSNLRIKNHFSIKASDSRTQVLKKRINTALPLKWSNQAKKNPSFSHAVIGPLHRHHTHSKKREVCYGCDSTAWKQ